MDVNAGTPVVKVGADEIIGFDVKVTVLEEIVEDIVIIEESVDDKGEERVIVGEGGKGTCVFVAEGVMGIEGVGEK